MLRFFILLCAFYHLSVNSFASGEVDEERDPPTAVQRPGKTLALTNFPLKVIVNILGNLGIEDIFTLQGVSKQWRRASHILLVDYLRNIGVAQDLLNQWQVTESLVSEFKARYIIPTPVSVRKIYTAWTSKPTCFIFRCPNKLTVRQVDRFKSLPPQPPKSFGALKSQIYTGLALDQYRGSIKFPLDSFLPCILDLLADSRTIMGIGIKKKPSSIPWPLLFEALSTSSVTQIDFNRPLLSAEDLIYFCTETSATWRAKVTRLEFSSTQEKLPFAVFNQLLTSFQNLTHFDSADSFDLTSSPVMFPQMQNLESIEFSFDKINVSIMEAVVQGVVDNNLPNLKMLRIFDSDKLGDDALSFVLQLIDKRPALNLDIFSRTNFSETAMGEIIKALEK